MFNLIVSSAKKKIVLSYTAAVDNKKKKKLYGISECRNIYTSVNGLLRKVIVCY